MLKLFTSEENPGAEENVGGVAVNHREHQVVKLETEGSKVENHSSNGIPWIPRLQHEPWNLNSHRLICLVVLLKLCAVTKERECRPEDCCCSGCSHNAKKKTSHLR